jgi:hypothetical protein
MSVPEKTYQEVLTKLKTFASRMVQYDAIKSIICSMVIKWLIHCRLGTVGGGVWWQVSAMYFYLLPSGP